jgi:hypothetical protein
MILIIIIWIAIFLKSFCKVYFFLISYFNI